VTRALAPWTKAFGIDEARLSEIMNGLEMDLNQTRYLDFAGLRLYCHRVAGVVGTLAAGIFGYRNAATLEYAKSWARIPAHEHHSRRGRDAHKNRIYLPMTTQGVRRDGGRHHRRASSEDFERLMRFQASAPGGATTSAGAARAEDRQAQRPGLVMRHLRTLLDEIEQTVSRAQAAHRLTPVRKLWIAWRTWVRRDPGRSRRRRWAGSPRR